jgi:hypothetical protein
MAEGSVNSVPTAAPSPVHLGVRVRMVETSEGATSVASTAASFAGHSAAEAFIRAEVMKCKTFGSVGRRHWGRNHAEHQVHYWIETDQETASVQKHQQRRKVRDSTRETREGGMSATMTRVKLQGRSWKILDQGLYCFEATVDGEASEVRITEEVAFDLLGAFTVSSDKCLEVLRRHRTELARNLERKLTAVGFPGDRSLHFLSLNDVDRTNPSLREREISEWSDIDRSLDSKTSHGDKVLY